MSQGGSSFAAGAPVPSPEGGPRKPDAKKTPLAKRSYSFKLTFPTLLTALIVSLISLGWVFMLGVMVGRGDNPDAKVAEFAARVLNGNRAKPLREPEQTILKPEELDFIPALRDKPRFSAQHNATTTVVTAAVAGKPAAEKQAEGEIGIARNAEAATQPARPAMHDYVYQVATFKEPDQADRLRERLEGEGLRTRLEKSPARDGKSTFYKVHALLRGDEEDNRRFLASLERLRLGPPLLRAKNPVKSGMGR
jgi:hypothetical protein